MSYLPYRNSWKQEAVNSLRSEEVVIKDIPDDVSWYSYDLLTQWVEAAMYCAIGTAPHK